MTGIINITKRCNMACKYCYAGNYTNTTEQRAVVDESLKSNLPNIFLFIDKLIEQFGNKTSILYHGGEPTLASVKLLRSIADYAISINSATKLGIQTNGTLITDELMDFFSDYNFTVGISLDGPQPINDKNRVFPNGQGTAVTIKKNIKKLQERGINVGLLITFSNENINHIEEIYKMCREMNLGFSFNPLFIPEKEVGVTALDIDGYASSICKLFDIWINDQSSNISIRPFERILMGLVDNQVGLPVCSFSENCANEIITIDTDGMVYPCNHLAGMKEFSYGYISKIDIGECINNSDFAKRWTYLRQTDCAGCEFEKYCYGGCPSHSHAKNGTVFCKDEMCMAHKIIINHIYNYLQGFRK